MRRLFAASLAAMSAGFWLACAHDRPVEIPVPRESSASADAVVRIDVPADWRPLVPSPWRAEYLAPDNRSRAYVRAMPVEADAKGCPAIARQYAAEFIQAWGGPPETRVARKTSSGEQVDFELRRQDPKPDGEVIWARVVCRDGALAITSCTVPTPREQELGRRCRDIVESLQVLARPKPQNASAAGAAAPAMKSPVTASSR